MCQRMFVIRLNTKITSRFFRLNYLLQFTYVFCCKLSVAFLHIGKYFVICVNVTFLEGSLIVFYISVLSSENVLMICQHIFLFISPFDNSYLMGLQMTLQFHCANWGTPFSIAYILDGRKAKFSRLCLAPVQDVKLI